MSAFAWPDDDAGRPKKKDEKRAEWGHDCAWLKTFKGMGTSLAADIKANPNINCEYIIGTDKDSYKYIINISKYSTYSKWLEKKRRQHFRAESRDVLFFGVAVVDPSEDLATYSSLGEKRKH